MLTPFPIHSLRVPQHRRGGAVIIVALALMTTLLVLGLFFFYFTEDELRSAQMGSDAAATEYDIDVSGIFDDALRQAIVGPNDTENQSALYGGHHAMLANLLGTPVMSGGVPKYQPQLYLGGGARIVTDLNNDGFPDPTFDLDGSGAETPGGYNIIYGTRYNSGTMAWENVTRDQTNLILNFSPAANGGSVPTEGQAFLSGAGYTYPDVNSMFLAFDERVSGMDSSSGTPTGVTTRVVIPSYTRPQMLTAARSASLLGGAANGAFDPNNETAIQATYPNLLMRRTSLRPHSGHLSMVDGSARFVRNTTAAQSGDRNRIIEPFPFRVDLDGDGVANEMGVFTHYPDGNPYPANPVYELDGDVDRDGTPDSILMDLGLSIITLPDNRQVVPMAMMKWVDASGLLSINAHGNLANLIYRQTYDTSGVKASKRRKTPPQAQTPSASTYVVLNNLSTGNPLNASNMGLSPFEVNLALGLTADPNAVSPTLLTQHQAYLGPGYPQNRYQLGELEALMLFSGRRQYASDLTTLTSPTPLTGRYGDIAEVANLQNWSRSGNLLSASPNAGTLAGMPGPGAPKVDDDYDHNAFPALSTGTSWWGSPIDYLGIGNPTQLGTGTFLVRWLTNGIRTYGIGWGPSELQSPYQDPLKRNIKFEDDADEVVVEQDLRNANDALFDISEMFFLHGSSGDQRTMRLASRLQELASVNFRDSPSAPLIRRRFTIDSYDRLEFGLSPRPLGTNRAWEFNTWQFTWPNGEVYDRAFPPQFGDISVTPNTAVFGSLDPYRSVLRQLLTQRADMDSTTLMPFDETRTNLTVPLTQRRLDINRYLSGYTTSGQPIFRRPQVHPSGISAAVPAAGSPEYLARQERQRMARDIYVLLYTLGGGNDSVNYAATSNADPGMGDRPLYTDTQLERMAQFAVNLVDSTDENVIITRFEYDRDLSDGWNLDDNPFTDEGIADRGVVNGVEMPQLTINESMFVYSHSPTMANSGDTEWDDSSDRSFAYIELKNPAPYDVDLNADGWQLRLEIESPVGNVLTANSRDLYFRSGTATVPSLGIYTLGTAGDTGQMDSIMRLKSDNSQATYDKLIPASGSLDLDMIANMPGAGTYEVVNVGGTTTNTTQGDFFSPLTAKLLNDQGGVIRVSLRRRMNQYRTFPTSVDAANAENQDNPWIEVDRSEIEINPGISGNGFVIFDPDDTTTDMMTATTSLTHIRRLNSRHRTESLDRTSEQTSTTSTQGNDTLGTDNSSTALWLPVWDRDFTSVVELLSLPLYGPGDVTRYLKEWAGTGDDPRFAMSMILNPRKPSNASGSTNDSRLDNRWYRALEFLTVTPQSLERQANPYDSSGGIVGVMTYPRRLAGKINLNMLRHEAVLAGLLDDQTFDRYGGNPTQQVGVDTGRNWYAQLRRSRDGFDPMLANGGLTQSPQIAGLALNIPGSIDSHPFKPLSDATRNTTAILDDTIFRLHRDTWMDDSLYPGQGSTAFPDLGLFESRPQSHASSNNNEVDPYTRNRLLAKVVNNTTTRSTMFAGWIEIQFHEAHQLTSGAVQVGAEATDIRHRRLFVVVDLSRLEDAYDTTTMPDNFDFNEFVIYRQELP